MKNGPFEHFRARRFSILSVEPEDYHYVRPHGSGVILLPRLADGALLMVWQKRFISGQMTLELPCGGIEKGESPVLAAARELREETGYRLAPTELAWFGRLHPDNGLLDATHDYFFADLSGKKPSSPICDEISRVERVEVEVLWQKIEEGAVRDARTLCALALAARRGLL